MEMTLDCGKSRKQTAVSQGSFSAASRRRQTVIGAWVEGRLYVGSGCGGCPALLFWGESPLTNCNRCMGWGEIVRGVGSPEGVRRFFIFWRVAADRLLSSWATAGSRRIFAPIWLRRFRQCEDPSTRFACSGWHGAAQTERDIPAETPQYDHHTTLPDNCQLSVCEKLRILCFTPKFRKLFVLFPVL